MGNDEECAPSLEEQTRAEFRTEMDELIELNSRGWSTPERTAEQEEEPGLCALDDRFSEGLAAVAEHNRQTAESYREKVDSGEISPHEARQQVQEQTRDIEKIHSDTVAYREKRAECYVETTQQERAGEITDFEAERRREEIMLERRGKSTLLGLLSIGKDWGDVGDLSDDFYHIFADSHDPGNREKRKELRERFTALTPRQKWEFSRRIEDISEGREDPEIERMFKDDIVGYGREH